MCAPKLGNFKIKFYRFPSGEYLGEDSIQKFIDRYWNFKKADNPIQFLVAFMTFKDSYMIYKVAPNKVIKQVIECFNEGNFQNAKDLLKNELKNDKYNIEYLKLLGQVYKKMGNTTNAKELFLRVLKVNPNNRSTLINYISVCFQDCDVESAIKAIEQNIDLFSKNQLTLIAQSLTEAMNNRFIKYEELPQKLKDEFKFITLKKEGLSN